jgi:outer membrane lipoprotein SlyB
MQCRRRAATGSGRRPGANRRELKLFLNWSIFSIVGQSDGLKSLMKSLNMKTCISIFATAALSMVLTGCVNPDGTQNYTGSGALMGGGAGALTGAAIGGDAHGGQDALIGAAVGAVAGGLIGNSMDREQQARLQAQAPQTYARMDQGEPLSLADVKALGRAGVSEDVIISQIEATHTVYRLSAADIIELRNAGVSDRVVNFMINTPNTVGTSAVVVPQAPPPPPAQTVVVAPAPGYVWVTGEWVWNNGWGWRAGYWARPPYGCRVWVGGSYWRDGRGWHYNRGYWR